MPELSKPVRNVMPWVRPFTVDESPLQLAVGNRCGKRNTTYFASQELCVNCRYEVSDMNANGNGLDEVSDL
jgi:hypothetical protein